MGFNLITGTDQQAIEGLKHAIADPETGLAAQIEELDEEINDEETGLAAKVSELDEEINDEETGLAAKVSELDEEINDETTGLAAKVSSLDEQLNAEDTGLEDRVSDIEASIPADDRGFPARNLKYVFLSSVPNSHHYQLNSVDAALMGAVTNEFAVIIKIELDQTLLGGLGLITNVFYMQAEGAVWVSYVWDRTHSARGHICIYTDGTDWFFNYE